MTALDDIGTLLDDTPTDSGKLPPLDQAPLDQLQAVLADPQNKLPWLVLRYSVDEATQDVAAALTANLPIASLIIPEMPMGTASCGHVDGREPLFCASSVVDWAWLRLVCLRRTCRAAEPATMPSEAASAVAMGTKGNLDGLEFRRLWRSLYLTVGEQLEAQDPAQERQNLAQRLASQRGDKVFPRYYIEPSYDDQSNEFVYSKAESPRNHLLGQWCDRLRRLARYLWVAELKHIRVLTETAVCAENISPQHATRPTLVIVGPKLTMYGFKARNRLKPFADGTYDLVACGPFHSTTAAITWAAQWPWSADDR